MCPALALVTVLMQVFTIPMQVAFVLSDIFTIFVQFAFFAIDFPLFMFAAFFPFFSAFRIAIFDGLVFFSLIEVSLATVLIDFPLVLIDITAIIGDIPFVASNITLIASYVSIVVTYFCVILADLIDWGGLSKSGECETGR